MEGIHCLSVTVSHCYAWCSFLTVNWLLLIVSNLLVCFAFISQGLSCLLVVECWKFIIKKVSVILVLRSKFMYCVQLISRPFLIVLEWISRSFNSLSSTNGQHFLHHWLRFTGKRFTLKLFIKPTSGKIGKSNQISIWTREKRKYFDNRNYGIICLFWQHFLTKNTYFICLFY